jgi:hypothetical protein
MPWELLVVEAAISYQLYQVQWKASSTDRCDRAVEKLLQRAIAYPHCDLRQVLEAEKARKVCIKASNHISYQ